MLRFTCGVVVAMIALAGESARADVTVSSWDLLVDVYESSTGNEDYAVFTTPQTPFANQHAAVLGASSAAAQYLIEYFSNYGSFHIASQEQAAGLASSTVYSGSSGSIRISTTEPLPLHIEAAWSYNLPADWMMTQFGVHISGDASHTVLFHQHYNRQTLPGEPSSDTLPIQGDVTLLPGETWFIQYTMTLSADAGPDFSAAGNGYVNLLITPEASTLTMLAASSLLVLRRRTRRSC